MKINEEGHQVVYKLWNKKEQRFGTTGSRGRQDDGGSVYTRKPPKSYVCTFKEDYDDWEVLEFLLVPLNTSCNT